MIKPFCIMCDKELEEPGGILLSPPLTYLNRPDDIQKHHLCVNCYENVITLIRHNKQNKSTKV